MKEKTITARIDEQVGSEIQYLKHHLGVKNTTQVVTEAVHLYYTMVKEEEAKKSPFTLLEELDLIGSFEGEKGLSQNYKNQLTDSLHKKHRSLKRKKR